VKVGPPVGSWVEVLEGLEEGEPVVVSGSFVLKAELGKAGAVHEH
jgi:membrane fusion protein, heavy metal efflux system